MRKFFVILGLLFLIANLCEGQTVAVTGKVINQDGQPVAFASLRVKGSKQGVGADADGNFSIRAKIGDILLVTAADITQKEVTISNNAFLRIPVIEKIGNLSEVVVTAALGIKRQARELGYATTAIPSSQLNQAAVTNAATGLAAKVSGVDIRLADNSVNPQVKVTFRGTRSIQGSNTALIVVDGIPVDQTYLANLNPSDIEEVTILKGSNAAALYGMAASNGVMIINTKRSKGKFSLTYQNTVSFESISYFPKLQNEYSGWGGEPPGAYPNPATGGTIRYVDPFSGLALTVPYENESYGAAYNSKDFHLDSIPIGVNENMAYSYVPYRDVPNGRKDFFQTGTGDQNKLSGSFGNDKIGGIYFSGEHTSKQGVVPEDKYNRTGGRLNANLHFGRLSINGGISYNSTSTNIAGNSYNQNRPVYYDVINQLPSVDLQKVKNVNEFIYNQGYIDAYYPNPWWQVVNSRAKNNTGQLLANLQLNFKVNDWISVTARGGYNRTSTDAPSTIDSITFPAWLSANGGPWEFGNEATNPGNVGFQVEDAKTHYSDLNGDLFVSLTKKVEQFKFTLIAGGNTRTRSSYGYWYSNQINSGPVLGANVIPSFDTKVDDSTNGSAYAEFQYKRFDQSLYGDMTIGFNNWLFLHGSYRNDWTSILDPRTRSFSYPSVDLSAVLSDALAFIRNSKTISFLKVRLGYAGTGNVSLEGYNEIGVMGNIAGGRQFGGYSVAVPDFGAYAIYPLARVGTGFPFGTLHGFSQSTAVVQNGLKPEITKSKEFGFQIGLFANRINLEANYYDQKSKNQTIPLQTSNAAGVNTFLTNAGELDNSGTELDLGLTPLIRINNFKFDLSVNFSYQNSKVVSIAGGQSELDQINFGTTTLGGIFAIQGKPYAQILTTDFERDPTGKIIVDGRTGLPTANPNLVDVGNSNYKYFLGVIPTFSYKSFSIKAVFDYRGGAKILNEAGNVMDFSGISVNDAQDRQAFIFPNSVIETSPGKFSPNTNVPITSQFRSLPSSIFFWANFYNQIGAAYVTSAAFIKLREVSVNYDLPGKWLGTQKVVKGLSLALIGRNLFMWRPKTNIWSDPEFSTNGSGIVSANGSGNATGYTTEYQTPPTRIISISLTAKIF